MGDTTGARGDLIEVNGLSKRFASSGLFRKHDEVQAVDDVSFNVGRGETLAIVGESGAGKSTVGMMLLRLIEPDAGTIRVDGTDLRSMTKRNLRAWRANAQMVFQDPFGSFDPRMTMAASLTEPLVLHRGLRRKDRHDTAIGLLARVGLDERVLQRYPYEFSGGQLQRLAIARAIACEPKLVVCDEPVAALDMSIQAQIINLLKNLQRDTGITMVFVSHDLSLVRVIADRVAVMYRGRIVEIGPTTAIYEAPTHPYTQALISAVPAPNPRLQRHRHRLEIAPPDQGLGSGCAFSNRCPLAIAHCREVAPLLGPRGGGVDAACHLDAATVHAAASIHPERPAFASPALPPTHQPSEGDPQ